MEDGPVLKVLHFHQHDLDLRDRLRNGKLERQREQVVHLPAFLGSQFTGHFAFVLNYEVELTLEAKGNDVQSPVAHLFER